jgi:hypothetical protein
VAFREARDYDDYTNITGTIWHRNKAREKAKTPFWYVKITVSINELWQFDKLDLTPLGI